MRLIDADKLINELHKTVSSEDGYWKTVYVIKQQPTLEENKWISVETELPKNCDRVLFFGNYFSEREVDTCSVDWFLDNLEYMIAWQPLPKPYEPKKGSERYDKQKKSK